MLKYWEMIVWSAEKKVFSTFIELLLRPICGIDVRILWHVLWSEEIAING